MHHLVEEFFLPTLRSIDRRLPTADAADIPRLLAPIPLSVWGLLTLGVPQELPNLRRLVPAMPPAELQRRWVGAAGEPLLQQSIAFVEATIRGHRRWGNRRPLPRVRILDHGCGWGRHLRLFYRFTPETGLFGVDTSPEILAIAREAGVRGQLERIPAMPETLPFEPPFDIIYAFSILTHLSEETHRAALAVWRRWIAPDGLLVVTVRPRAFWAMRPDEEARRNLSADHDSHGFAFSNRQAGGYGDASIAVRYMRRNWTEWRIMGIDAALSDQHQVLVFLRPA
ncbi:hypothetical protein STAQ_40200 [Allostella sp. ATCC 35155]|nr:hypothetical protein STAQ_40200 [Stella sp. ATCC 35155]